MTFAASRLLQGGGGAGVRCADGRAAGGLTGRPPALPAALRGVRLGRAGGAAARRHLPVRGQWPPGLLTHRTRRDKELSVWRAGGWGVQLASGVGGCLVQRPPCCT